MRIQLIRSQGQHVGVKDTYPIHALTTKVYNPSSKQARLMVTAKGHAQGCEYQYPRTAYMTLSLAEAQALANQLIAGIEQARIERHDKLKEDII